MQTRYQMRAVINLDNTLQCDSPKIKHRLMPVTHIYSLTFIILHIFFMFTSGGTNLWIGNHFEYDYKAHY